MKKTAKSVSSTPLATRKQLGLNQAQFWGRIGVTQSGGSRYESGRAIPKPVKTLLDLAYHTQPLDKLAELRGVAVGDLSPAATPAPTTH